MPKKMKYTIVIDDPERNERLEIDIDTPERGLAALEALFHAERVNKICMEGLSREEKRDAFKISNRTMLRHFANRITNTKTGEVLKDFPLKAKRLVPKRSKQAA